MRKTVRVLNFEIAGEFIDYVPGRAYLSNGDPGYPPKPAEFEIISVDYKGVDVVALLENLYVRRGNSNFVNFLGMLRDMALEEIEAEL